MALAKPHKLVEDTSSEIVRVSRKELNKLMTAFAALIAASQLADFAAFKAAAVGLDAQLKQVLASHELPPFPEAP
jgi:hypothetical protein